MVRRTADGLLLTPDKGKRSLGVGGDGLPLLTLGRPVGNVEAGRYRSRARQPVTV
ncbi:hypothetical protein BH24ACT8_BH24ACT8_07130 [soil metagenome]|jgi:hypothetical protein